MKSNGYDLIFVTTFINHNAINTLLESIAFNTSINLGVVLVAQNGLVLDIKQYSNRYNTLYMVVIADQVNSSKGRNIGIEYVIANGINSKFVMFPDDDSSFDTCFFTNFNSLNSSECYVIDVLKEATSEFFIHVNAKEGQKLGRNAWNSVGATNMILNYSTFKQVGFFDEQMGVAATYGSGEDGDYFIRGLEVANHYLYTSKVYCYHPSGINRYSAMTTQQVIRRFRNYARGVIYMLCKHKMYGQAFKISFKALAGSILKFCVFDFRMSTIYLIAFYERLTLLIAVIFNRLKYYDNGEHSNL